MHTVSLLKVMYSYAICHNHRSFRLWNRYQVVYEDIKMSNVDSSPSVSNLFPAIAQSFAVIIIGYVFGYFKIIPPSEARSIGTLVGKLALPALLFKNLAILDLSSISWSFLGGMLIAKFSLFLGVAIITLLVTRPFSIGRAGLYGIFATQSNDFALGLPIGMILGLTLQY